ncbi:hypothetical protein FHS23_003490 [Prauserella isguenensis]|uniref:SnoaL-like polyketide cyclase n=1 Tax=Prauserella isguenensis TaxID=1470180 RepID=A0A839S3Y2_9PSEU|nr:ester cyclase [Prauserella isguenensis]MBB3052456.1 hypothetical protein [Prauserella isguenensis]
MRDTAQRWLDAWRAGSVTELTAVAESFSDPDTDGAVSGAELAEHLAGVLRRFPRWPLDAETTAETDDTIVLTWTVTAAHRAPYLGIPSAGGDATISGVDVLTRSAGRVSVTRRFDRLALARSLGYDARFLPPSTDVVDYGISMGAGSSRTAAPGALTLTWLDVHDDEEGADVDLLTYEVVKSLRHSKGFLGAAIFEIGGRRYTLSAFTTLDAVRAVHAKPHQRAMRRFFRGGLCTGAYTSVWSLERDSVYLRCAGCSAVVPGDRACDCGNEPSARPLIPLPEE